MKRALFFEPRFAPGNRREWEIRGSYKYRSLLAPLMDHAEPIILMSALPPDDDEHRRALEQDFGARFEWFDSLDDSGSYATEELRADFRAAITRFAPDVVSTLNGRMIGYNFALARAAADIGIDYVYRIAGNDIASRTAVFEARGRPVRDTAFRANLIAQDRVAAAIARTIIVMSESERHRVSEWVGDASKISVCRRGVDQSHFTPPSAPPEKCERFLFLGRDSEEKGIDLIERVADLVADRRPDICFTIAGEFEPRDSGNRCYRGFYGYADLAELYRDHHAFVLPARSEGFPQVMMEAMSCGLPVIASEHLFRHDFSDGEGAFLVGLDAEEIAGKAIALHDDPTLYARCREQALSHARADFDALANADRYRAALLEAA